MTGERASDDIRNWGEAEEVAGEMFKQFMELIIPPEHWDEHLEDTPERVAKSRLQEIFRGYRENPREHLSTTFPNEDNYRGDSGWVVVDNIEVNSMCAHHFLPFVGVAHVGYIPEDEVVGLSKFARLVDGYARRAQYQERLTNQIANAIDEELDPIAAMVVIEAEHQCMSCRGVQEPHSKTRTSAPRGRAHPTNDDRAATIKQEFFEMVSNGS